MLTKIKHNWFRNGNFKSWQSINKLVLIFKKNITKMKIITILFIKKHFYCISFILIISIFILFHFLNISLSLAAAIAAIIISINGIRLSRESLILPAKLKHSEDLRKIITSWKTEHIKFYDDTVKQLVLPNNRIRINFRKNKRIHFMKEIHSPRLYKDLINVHLSKNYKNLYIVFLEYHRLISEYNKILKKTYEYIKKFAVDYFEKNNNGFKPDIENYKGNDTINLNFFNIIYLYFYTQILPKKSNDTFIKFFFKNKESSEILSLFKFNIYESPQSFISNKKEITNKMWILDISISNTIDNRTLSFSQKKETAENYEKLFKEIFNFVLKNKELKDLRNEVIEKKGKIDKKYSLILSYLNDLEQVPIFNDECDFIKKF